MEGNNQDNAKIKDFRCSNCKWCMVDMVPDLNAEYKCGKARPKVRGFRCHISRVCGSGFPIVNSDDYCAFWTDKETLNQPYKHCLEVGGKIEE